MVRRWIVGAALLLCAAACSKAESRHDGGGGVAAREDALQEAPAAAPEKPAAASRDACVDAWLRERGLNEFGDSKDTMYAGGTPLFDEATGTRRERIPFLLGKHPELAAACP